MFWSRQTILDQQQADPLILPADSFDPRRLIRGAYELRIGSQAHITSDTERTVDLKPGERVIIPPGQFGILITMEHVHIPTHMLGFISIKASEKFKGLVNVSGFHVDPGFSGPLKFAVYNAGPNPVELDQGKPAFLIWFAQLDHPEDPYPNDQRPGRLRITDEDVEKIQGDIASPGALKAQFDKLRDELDQRLRPIEFYQKMFGLLFSRTLLVIVGLILGALFRDKLPFFSNQPATTDVKDTPAKDVVAPK